MAAGIRHMSLLEPSAWEVLEPSKFHSGKSTRKGTDELYYEGLNHMYLLTVYGRLRVLLTFKAFWLKIQSPGFAAEPLSCSINPYVHGLDFIPLRELHVLLLHSFTQRGAWGRSHLISFYNTPEDKKRRAGVRPRWALDHMLRNWAQKNKNTTIVSSSRKEEGRKTHRGCQKKPHFQYFPPSLVWKQRELASACPWPLRLDLMRKAHKGCLVENVITRHQTQMYIRPQMYIYCTSCCQYL